MTDGVKLEKEPGICDAEMVKWIIMFQFANRNMKLVKERGITDRKKGSNGQNKTAERTV